MSTRPGTWQYNAVTVLLIILAIGIVTVAGIFIGKGQL